MKNILYTITLLCVIVCSLAFFGTNSTEPTWLLVPFTWICLMAGSGVAGTRPSNNNLVTRYRDKAEALEMKVKRLERTATRRDKR